MKQVEQQSFPLHQLTLLQLGSEGRIKTHDMMATVYLKKIDMQCLEFTGKSCFSQDLKNNNIR